MNLPSLTPAFPATESSLRFSNRALGKSRWTLSCSPLPSGRLDDKGWTTVAVEFPEAERLNETRRVSVLSSVRCTGQGTTHLLTLSTYVSGDRVEPLEWLKSTQGGVSSSLNLRTVRDCCSASEVSLMWKWQSVVWPWDGTGSWGLLLHPRINPLMSSKLNGLLEEVKTSGSEACLRKVIWSLRVCPERVSSLSLPLSLSPLCLCLRLSVSLHMINTFVLEHDNPSHHSTQNQ